MDCLKAKKIESQNLPSQEPTNCGGTTFCRTCFNGLNTLSGVGILSIPFALSEGGWLSLILLFQLALLCWYTGLLLQRCMDGNPRIKSYPDIGEVAYGQKGRLTISIFMYLELYLVAVELLILEGDNLNQLFPSMGFNMAGFKVGGKQCFVLLTALVILPTTWLKNLGLLAYVSAGGVFASLLLVAFVFWVGTVDGVGFHEGDVLLNFKGLPTAVSLYLFCYCGHAVFPTLCNSMKDRSKFSKVLLFCFVVSTITYGSMAVLGYLMFGQDLKSQVTLNLPIRKISSRIAIYITIINPLTKYAIIITPIAAAIEDTRPFRNSLTISIFVRTLIVISTVIVALSIPFFSYLMALVGASLSVTVSVLLPCLFYLKINVAARRFGFELVVIVGIMVIGSFVGVVVGSSFVGMPGCFYNDAWTGIGGSRVIPTLENCLWAEGIRADGNIYSLSSIKEAIKSAIGYTPGITCNEDASGNSQLYEVYICVDTSGSNLIECPVLPGTKCSSKIEFPSF